MKKAELVEGQRYWISADTKWKESGDGEVGEFTGYTNGLKAQFTSPERNPDTPWDAMFVHVRAPFADAARELAPIWARNKQTDEKRVAFRKRAQFLGLADTVGVSDTNVILSHEDFDKLTRLAKNGMSK